MASRVIVHGPLWNGEAAFAVDDWLRDTRYKVADQGLQMLREFPMNRTGRARGGFQKELRVVTRGMTEVLPGPKDKGVTWAPWLEGTSKRNDSTRFKGYHLFRKTRLKMRKVANKTAQEELDKFIGRMGGER